MNKAKQIGLALMLGSAFVIAPAFSTFSNVQAQSERWQRRNDRNRDRYDNGRYGRNDDYSRNNGYNNAQVQKGYRDGLDRGRKDAQTNRAMDPNNSSHYRDGNPSYRRGFERGFYEAYRRYSGRRR